MHAGPVAEEVLVLECHLRRRFRTELAAVVHVVPAQSKLKVEVAQVEVDGCEFALKLIVKNVVGAVTVHIDVHVVAPESAAERGPSEATGVHGQLSSCHQALTQSQRDVGIDGYVRL